VTDLRTPLHFVSLVPRSGLASLCFAPLTACHGCARVRRGQRRTPRSLSRTATDGHADGRFTSWQPADRQLTLRCASL